jgi:hypothetical protein
MKTEQVAALARQLTRVRRSLQAESPYGPAWAATSEWVDDLERQMRDLGIDPDGPAIEMALATGGAHLRVA